MAALRTLSYGGDDDGGLALTGDFLHFLLGSRDPRSEPSDWGGHLLPVRILLNAESSTG